MPWKESTVESLRMEFVMRAREPGANLSDLCREYAISRKTGYKWITRYADEGLGGLTNRSRRPLEIPCETPSDVVVAIVRLKVAHPSWGPKKIRELLIREGQCRRVPAVSTVARLLRRAGLTEPKGRGARPRRWDPQRPMTKAGGPNELWTVDLKGWWRAGNGRMVEPLSVRDAYSRYVLCLKPLEKKDTETARREFSGIFDRYGLPKKIRSDNGSPFASVTGPHGLTQLSAWWKMLGIELERIEPGHPEQNGAHERLHADIAKELQARPMYTVQQECQRLEEWRLEYNANRPHEALRMRTPAEKYSLSPRRFPQSVPDWSYPSAYQERWVRRRGQIVIGAQHVFVSDALKGWKVGIDLDTSMVYFCDLCLGKYDRKEGKIHR